MLARAIVEIALLRESPSVHTRVISRNLLEVLVRYQPLVELGILRSLHKVMDPLLLEDLLSFCVPLLVYLRLFFFHGLFSNVLLSFICKCKGFPDVFLDLLVLGDLILIDHLLVDRVWLGKLELLLAL